MTIVFNLSPNLRRLKRLNRIAHKLIVKIDPNTNILCRRNIRKACNSKNTARLCAAVGTKCLVSLEKKMACGIGACLGCTCHTENGPRSVCKDGPVFDAAEIYQEEVQA